eukprot:TRINITY_DN21688_c0_g1_i1.p1 TRINITY_DN21688_c0_g1~~TRINITY_DN21688_c0_g1_i1.p1  ORF type:complete len:353 (+),score=81.96 TRINITY_DN21688_c0_g1_i1:44-1102(+)
MKAIVIPSFGGYSVLQVREFPDLEPSEKQVRIRVRAAGLNFAETMARQGLYPDAPPAGPGCIVGYEGAGIIDKVGSAVSLATVGQRVLFLSRFGAHADTVVVPEDQVFPIPTDMSFSEAAAIPVVFLTAYHAIFRIANLRKGESILIHAAAGGVGLAALQLSKMLPGVTVFGTASASKHAKLKEFGCDHCIDYTTTDFAAEVMRITEGKGVNVILDAVGGDSLKRGSRILKMPGRLISYGFSTASSGETRNLWSLVSGWWNTPVFNPLSMMGTNIGVSGVNMLSFFAGDGPAYVREEMIEIMELFTQGKLKAVVDSEFKFSQAAEAHRRMGERKNVGKIVLVPDEPIQVGSE